ncbi:hypothetical protein [Pseudomonas sp. RIT-PI-a]|uniref:hypothetical protein n=1 Tax=Pseudomonas sp. RIT-PI-a TaxID=1681194 RepID=UPI0006760ED6|nr:hypothetical protein [Pseudomonas sp. RIT-PI-a]KNC16748.1 hypothetical protein AC788_04290 [Pseudomonas sp. RIT-PI-a]
MEIEDEEFGCLGIPTEAQIWKQQAELVQAEYEQVAADLRQARTNILKLVDIHAVTARERDQALHLLASYKRDLSAAHVELSALGNRMRGMQMAARQSAESPYPFRETLAAPDPKPPLPARCPSEEQQSLLRLDQDNGGAHGHAGMAEPNTKAQ